MTAPLPAFVVPEVAVELELGDPDDTPVELGHDHVQALELGVVEPAVSQMVRVQQLLHHRVVGLDDVTDERHDPSLPGPPRRGTSERELIERFWPVGQYGPYPQRLREQFEGLVWRFRTGSQWRKTPREEFRDWQTVYERLPTGP